MGHTRTTKYIVVAVVLLQLSLACLLAAFEVHPLSPLFLGTAYLIGGTANQNTFLAIHEISHNMAFKGVLPNRLLAMVANLAIGVPYSVVFKVRNASFPAGGGRLAAAGRSTTTTLLPSKPSRTSPDSPPPPPLRLFKPPWNRRSTTSSTTSAWAKTASTPTYLASLRPSS